MGKWRECERLARGLEREARPCGSPPSHSPSIARPPSPGSLAAVAAACCSSSCPGAPTRAPGTPSRTRDRTRWRFSGTSCGCTPGFSRWRSRNGGTAWCWTAPTAPSCRRPAPLPPSWRSRCRRPACEPPACIGSRRRARLGTAHPPRRRPGTLPPIRSRDGGTRPA